MQLIFEHIKTEITQGSYPDLIHFANTQAQIFNIQNGKLVGLPTDQIDYGLWENVEFQDELDVAPDDDMSHFEIKVLQGFGIVGSYKNGNVHKLIIYEFEFTMDDFLESGSISHSIDDPISKFDLSFKNPRSLNPEHPGNEALSELNSENNLLAPGGKIRIYFGAGQEDPDYEMGTFYIDRSQFELLNSTVSVDGRNTIGKILKDQTLDEKNEFWYQTITESLKELFQDSGLEADKYYIESTDKSGWFTFAPSTNLFSAIGTMLEVLPNWRVIEKADGIIVIGSSDYSVFDEPGVYTFYRDKDIFSRQIVRDDENAYNRVCVHTENFEKAVYRNVKSFKSWNLQANKTLYVQIAEGLKYSDLATYAEELAERMEGVGKIETFRGPIRPHLQCGDEAIIINQNGSPDSIGIITEVTHTFGVQGYYTDFSVDSGGTVGTGRVSEWINKIVTSSSLRGPNTGWDDIDDEEYINIAVASQIVVSSTKNASRPPSLLNNNLMYAPNDKGWSPATDDTNPYIEIIFGQKCMINSVQMWFGYDDIDTDPKYLPDYYQVRYYDNGSWKEIITIDSVSTPIEIKMTHDIAAIETSKIRITLHPKANQLWREIQVLGWI